MTNHYQVTIHAITPEQQDILIALLSNEGYESFEQDETSLKAFIPEGSFDEKALTDLSQSQHFTWTADLIERRNWNALWESNFEPVQVDDFAGIRADFHPPFTGVGHEIVITPKMSFGTGHHATTYMMMQLMRELSFENRSVFDFGCGTGILAILAEKLGANPVVGVDNDDWCIENSVENLAINQCSHTEIKKIDILSFDRSFDIILANINRHIILENIHILKGGLADGGTILFSGLLEQDEKDIHEACQSVGLQHNKTIQRNGWIALSYF